MGNSADGEEGYEVAYWDQREQGYERGRHSRGMRLHSGDGEEGYV